MIEYISVKETAQNWKISVRRIQTLCEHGRVEGAMKVGNAYIIPINASKPEDKRKKIVL